VLAAWAAAVTGLLLSWWLDTPSGPTIALCLTLWGTLSLFVTPRPPQSTQAKHPPRP
jgi:ABC-type Mn2+/Zn2+ transport system permease subunit